MRQPLRICVVGGLNVDISGTPFRRLRPVDSNPGRVHLSLGGVGRNLAESLSLLGCEVSLITVLGDDAFTPWIQADCAARGIRLDQAQVAPDAANGYYLCLNEADGDLHAAVADMEICARITPGFLSERLAYLERADALVLDANLPEETLAWAVSHVHVPCFADPVSAAKAPRLRGALGGLALLKPNLPEGRALTGRQEPAEVAQSLLDAGVARVMITLGAKGVWFADAHAAGCQPALPAEIRSTNGCGDAFLSACVVATLSGYDIAQTALLGQAAAAICAESAAAVNEALTWAAVEARAKASPET